MATFPEIDTIAPNEPLPLTIQFKTLISQFDDLGEEQRKQKWLYPKRHPRIVYQGITKANAATLWQFYLDRKGSYEAFSFFVGSSTYAANTYEGEYVGTGDGSTTVFNLPAKNSSDYTVYVNGVEKSGGGVDYTFGEGTGTDGADKITFVAAPAAGDRITYDFTGTLKIRCTFAEDNLDFDSFYDRVANMGLQLKGQLNA